VASTQELLISRLVYIKTRNSKEYTHFYRIQQAIGTKENIVQPNRKWKIQDGGLQTGTTYISACGWDRNEISTAKPTFSRSSNLMGLRRILYYKTGSGKSKMADIIQTINTELKTAIGTAADISMVDDKYIAISYFVINCIIATTISLLQQIRQKERTVSSVHVV
jgi:hypothetical protein